MKIKSFLLTKSKYLAGLQCLKLLWIKVYEPDKLSEVGESDQARFDEGELVGEYAKKLFPKGIDIPFDSFEDNIKRTEETLKLGKPLFEAGIRFGNCYARADILVPVGKRWDLIEVKSSTEVKDVHLEDVSFQKYCYEGFGLKIRKCYLMHLNNKYVRRGEINPKRLFVKEDITKDVDLLIKDVKNNINKMFNALNSGKCPKVLIGCQCGDPYPCRVEECWEFLPKHNVCDLRKGKKKGFELIESGIYSIKEIPEDVPLTAHQSIQKKCIKTGKPHVEKEGIKEFLEELRYPLRFLDFETFNTGIPMYDGLKPYQMVPFQYSLHVLESEKSKPKHYSFLAEGNKDPRKELIKSLKKIIGTKGSIVTYNSSFEIGRLKELAKSFPENKKWVNKACKRVIDLIIPFRKFYYYHPEQHGEAGLKSVLPPLTGKTYEGLKIADGGTASLAYLTITFENATEKEKQKTRQALLKYCSLDTEAMILIIEELRRLSK